MVTPANNHFDAIIIGAGQAGPALAVKLAHAGQRVAVIERQHVGGSCINFGCTPTKAMVASARSAWMARRAADFGVHIDGDIKVDMDAVAQRTARIVQESRKGLYRWLNSTAGISLVEGHARFTAPDRIQVGDLLLHGERFFINTGTRPVVPDIPGLAETDFWTPARMTRVDHLPEHLVVLGGGYIGIEFAQMFRRFGSRVTVVERGARLLEQEDTDISEAVRQVLEEEDIDVRLETEASEVRAAANGVTVGVEGDGTGGELHGSNLLLALGRRPNSDDLDLEAAGVDTDEGGYIRVNDRLRTGVESIWALGDVNGKGAFTHTAYDDHEIVADTLLGEGKRSLGDRFAAHAVYIDPPLGRVGLTEAQARESGRRTLLAKMPMSGVARARERGETRGLMKVLVDDETDRFIGATIFGISGDEVVHSILNLMYADAPYQRLRDRMGIHPTVSELLPTLLERLEPV
ncbi:MAG: FAD-containing oxidoreductase [Gammaproteobacteria bacterium]|jgi:pyruvate/2-oxoglutarate dehydrogenase complex dihydrolipoamide dehydrogenase (E3) component